eukprot:TRINITY_DN102981_c0_g1_i1.p1 TRINITY_DN102981_c0_g1~~TRINITY_DN102981_c0_g1_i1.p1  ORF type:complete len:327 (-),score=58.79 TRINITY_DN102981_c0_g1_i1:71-991(-)
MANVFPGLPTDLGMSLDDFVTVTAAIETEGGRILAGRYIEMVNNKIVLDDDHANEFEVAIDEVIALQFNAKRDPDWENSTLEVPVSWINRFVAVKLPHGEVCGLLSDSGLGATRHVHLNAMPGSPAVPPLPTDLVQAVALVSRAFHASLQTCGEGKWNIHRYYLQDGQSMVMRELHTPAGLPEEIYLQQLDGGSDIILQCPLDLEVYDMKFASVLGPASNQCYFYRFPSPIQAEGRTVAHSDSFQAKWQPAGMPDWGKKETFWVELIGSHGSSQITSMSRRDALNDDFHDIEDREGEIENVSPSLI